MSKKGLWEIGEVRRGWRLDALNQGMDSRGLWGTAWFTVDPEPEADEEDE